MNTEPSEREEAPRPTGWQSAQVAFDNPRMVKVLFETPECAEAFIDGVEPADGPIVAATRMRERCVDRVKEMGQQWQDQRLREKRDLMEHAAMMCGAKAEAAYEITRVLESLTLEEEQKR